MSELHREEILKSASEAEKAWFWSEHAKRQPYRCPICNGVGLVPVGFYIMGTVGSNVAPEPCRACTKGIVWG